MRFQYPASLGWSRVFTRITFECDLYVGDVLSRVAPHIFRSSPSLGSGSMGIMHVKKTFRLMPWRRWFCVHIDGQKHRIMSFRGFIFRRKP
jgi:hypothetical protein